MPPRFTRINQKTPEEQEATTQYETPADSQKQSINEELGIQDITDINEDWYPPPESELASSVQNLLDSQPMEVDDPPEEWSYQMFDEASDVLGPEPGPAPLFKQWKTVSSTLQADSPGLRGKEDQSPDLWPVPPVVRSRDVPPKDRQSTHLEEDCVATDEEQRMKTEVSFSCKFK